MENLNQVRGFRFMEQVFRSQAGDPYCPRCSAFANTLRAVRERLDQFSSGQAGMLQGLSAGSRSLLQEACAGLASIAMPSEPIGQKRAGNCRLPQGVCFIKASYSLVSQF